MDILGIGKKISQFKLVLSLKSLWGKLYDPQRGARIIMSDKVIEVKPAMKSKINITAILGGIAAILKLVANVEVPADLLEQSEALILLATSVVTIVLRTWFTTKLTPSSTKKLP